MTVASVLVVDNDVSALASVRAILSTAGYGVNEARGGHQALARVSANPPDLLVTEILMPDGDGIELIATVKRTHPKIRIIAVTGRPFIGQLDLLHLASALGADAVLDKPVEPDKLLVSAARLVGFDARLL